MSDRVNIAGIFNIPDSSSSSQITAQTMWYVIEGMHFRTNEYPFSTNQNCVKYTVSCDEHELTFYQSTVSKRWWIEVPKKYNPNLENILLSCAEEDYFLAEKGTVPERWWKAIRRSII
jgi:hypothetical protein